MGTLLLSAVFPFLLKLFLFLMLALDERSNARSSKVNIINKIKNNMQTKQELQARVQQINQQISQLHDEGIKIVGKLELLEEQEKATAETPK